MSILYTKLTLSDIPAIRPFFDGINSRACDFTVGGMFMWRDFYNMHFAVDDGTLFIKMTFPDGVDYYAPPLSGSADKIKKGILKLVSDENGDLRFATVPEEFVPFFKDVLPHAAFFEQTELSDYLYNADDLISLKGRKYAAQRNLISNFKRSFPDFEFKAATEVPTEELKAFLRNGYTADKNADEEEQNENREVLEVLDNLTIYGFSGCVLFGGGKIMGFSLGEKVGDTLFTHIEKANREVHGAYQMLVTGFSSSFGAEAQYINREEDMGDEGLRRAKLAYHPTKLLKKYIAEVHL